MVWYAGQPVPEGSCEVGFDVQEITLTSGSGNHVVRMKVSVRPPPKTEKVVEAALEPPTSGNEPPLPALPKTVAFTFGPGRESVQESPLDLTGARPGPWTIHYVLTPQARMAIESKRSRFTLRRTATEVEFELPIVRFDPLSMDVREGEEFRLRLSSVPRPREPLSIRIVASVEGKPVETKTLTIPLDPGRAELTYTVPDDGLSGPRAPWTFRIEPWNNNRSGPEFRLGDPSEMVIVPKDRTGMPALTLGEPQPSPLPENSGVLRIPVKIAPRPIRAATVTLEISGTAVRGRHFTPPRAVTIGAGVSEGRFEIPIVDDARFELPRTLVVRATAPGVVASPSTTVTIEDDDPLTGKLLVFLLPTTDLAETAELLTPALHRFVESCQADLCFGRILVPQRQGGFQPLEATPSTADLKQRAVAGLTAADALPLAIREIGTLQNSTKAARPKIVILVPYHSAPKLLDEDVTKDRVDALAGLPPSAEKRLFLYVLGTLGESRWESGDAALGRSQVRVYAAEKDSFSDLPRSLETLISR